MSKIKFENVNIGFNNELIYDKFSIEIYRGMVNTFIGKSGVGKTTIANYLKDRLLELNFRVSYVFQEDRLIPWKSVYDNLRFVRDSNEKILEILEIVELLEYKDYYPRELSGGMKQRVNLARALLYDSQFLILDEPFKGLDINIIKKIILAIKKYLNNNGRTAIFISHDINHIMELGGRANFLSGIPVKLIASHNLNDVTKEDIIKLLIMEG